MEPLRPNDKRAKNAITFFWILVIIEALAGVSGFQQFLLLRDVQNGVEVSESRASLNDLREQAIAVLFLAVFIVCIVLFLMWFRRATLNLEKRVEHLAHPGDQAVYMWFVPIMTFYRPFQIMRELYTETIYLIEKHSISLGRTFSSDFLGIWWALWIVNNISGQVVFRLSRHAEEIDELILATRAGIASNIIGVFATLAVIKVVSDYSKMEPALAQVPEPEPVTA